MAQRAGGGEGVSIDIIAIVVVGAVVIAILWVPIIRTRRRLAVLKARMAEVENLLTLREADLDGHLTGYHIRLRRRPSWRPTLDKPWELLRDGLPIGFYETEEQAKDMRARLEEVDVDLRVHGIGA